MPDLDARIRAHLDHEHGDFMGWAEDAADHADALRAVLGVCNLGDEFNDGAVATKAVRGYIARALGVSDD